MNRTQFVSQLAAGTTLSKAEAASAVTAVFSTISNALARGESVTIAGFGSFTIRSRAARQGRNPATGETITIAASRASHVQGRPYTSRCRQPPPRLTTPIQPMAAWMTMNDHPPPLITVPIDLSDEAAAKMLDFLYEFAYRLESTTRRQLYRYHNAIDERQVDLWSDTEPPF